MSLITLKYGSTSLELNSIICDDNDVTERKTGRMLNGVAYSHLNAAWREWEIVISADELCDSTKLAFIRAFWKSGANKQLKIGSGSWIDVVIEGGAAPKENIEGNKYLPEYKLRLIERNGGV